MRGPSADVDGGVGAGALRKLRVRRGRLVFCGTTNPCLTPHASRLTPHASGAAPAGGFPVFPGCAGSDVLNRWPRKSAGEGARAALCWRRRPLRRRRSSWHSKRRLLGPSQSRTAECRGDSCCRMRQRQRVLAGSADCSATAEARVPRARSFSCGFGRRVGGGLCGQGSRPVWIRVEVDMIGMSSAIPACTTNVARGRGRTRAATAVPADDCSPRSQGPPPALASRSAWLRLPASGGAPPTPT